MNRLCPDGFCLNVAGSGVHAAHMFGRKRQERQLPRALDGERNFALMPRAGADFASRANLAAIGQIAAQLVGVFIINDFVFVFAIDTDPALLRRKTALPVASVTAAVVAAVRTGATRTAVTAAAGSGTAA